MSVPEALISHPDPGAGGLKTEPTFKTNASDLSLYVLRPCQDRGLIVATLGHDMTKCLESGQVLSIVIKAD